MAVTDPSLMARLRLRDPRLLNSQVAVVRELLRLSLHLLKNLRVTDLRLLRMELEVVVAEAAEVAVEAEIEKRVKIGLLVSLGRTTPTLGFLSSITKLCVKSMT